MSAVQPISGVDVFYVLDETPAESIELSQGCVITYINDTKVVDLENFAQIMDNTKPNQTINITYMVQDEKISTHVELISRYDYYHRYTNENLNESLKNDSFLGIGFNPYDKEYLLSSIKNPFTYEFPNGLLNLYVLPFFGYIAKYNPIAYPFTNSFIITGPLNVLPTEVFWGIINTLYWVFWISLALGIFNVLPMIPLDGGFLFNDAIKIIVKKIKKDIKDETRDKIVRKITTIASFAVLLMILLPFLVKYI
jgi:membrane-associated protease RseP (regulator of RpoE activity)